MRSLLSEITSIEAKERLLADLPESATFGAQFRMNASRALLLPRERAGKRTPLWLSRLRAKDLLQAVRGLPDFPITLETYRDCLRDVFDLAGLSAVIERLNAGKIEIIIHETMLPSPVAISLDFQLASQYVYEYDQPRQKGRGGGTALFDRELLGELLRDGTIAGLLRPEAIVEVTSRATRLAPSEKARTIEELAGLIYELGDLSIEEVALRITDPSLASRWIESLQENGRVIEWRFGRQKRLISAERKAEYERIAVEPGPLLRRYLAHSGPTRLGTLAQRYDLSSDAAREILRSLGEEVVAGRFSPTSAASTSISRNAMSQKEGVRPEDEEWIDRHNLESMHRRTLGLLRKEIRPLPVEVYNLFLIDWQGVVSPEWARGNRVGGDEGEEEQPTDFALAVESQKTRLRVVLQKLRGLGLPGVAWERDILPARLGGSEKDKSASRAALSELCSSGEVMWVCEGGRDPRRARVRFFFRGEGGLFLPRRLDDETIASVSEKANAVYEFLKEEGAALLVDITEGTALRSDEAREALAELALAGLVTNDSLDALRTILGRASVAARERPISSLEAELALRLKETNPNRLPSRNRLRDARRRARGVVTTRLSERAKPANPGRWSLVHRVGLLGRALSAEERVTRQARLLLARWGVVTKACLERESSELGWADLSSALSRLEARGEVRRGYFVEGLPGLQFALPEAITALRGASRKIEEPGSPITIAATDPALPFERQSPRYSDLTEAEPAEPTIGSSSVQERRLRVARVPSMAVCLVAGEVVATAEASEDGALSIDLRDGSFAAALAERPALVDDVLRSLGRFWASRLGRRPRVERFGGEPVFESEGAFLLERAGFVREYGGMAWVR